MRTVRSKCSRNEKVSEQLLKSHETGRGGHGSAGPDSSGLEFYAELKYNILMEHLDTQYGQGAEKKKGEVPQFPNKWTNSLR